MKKITLYILFCSLLSSAKISAQNCVNGVSTDPANPTNNSLPSVDILGVPNASNSLFLNRFDWNKNSQSGIGGYDINNMTYDGLTPITMMANVSSSQTLPYYNYLHDTEKPTTKNGWEILLVNLGYFPDNTPHPNQLYNSLPYIVLYNRYSGLLRVFVSYGKNETPANSIDGVQINVSFRSENNLSGLNRLYEGNDQGLDQKSDVVMMTAVAKTPGFANRWYSSDFQIAYDPCTCYYPSELQLSFEFFDTESLELHGRGIEVTQSLLDNDTTLAENDFLGSFDYTGQTAEGGMIMYNEMERLVADYIAGMEEYQNKLAAVNEHNTQVDFYLGMLKLFDKAVLKGGGALISNYIFEPWFQRAEKEAYHHDIFVGDSIKIDKVKQQALKAFSFGAKQLSTFIGKNFQKQEQPTKPAMPTATFSEMHFKGQLREITPIPGPNFFTPGTYGTEATKIQDPNFPNDTTKKINPIIEDPYSYPIYNEILGTFALLESPKILLSHTVQDTISKREERFYQTSGIVQDGTAFGTPGTVWGVESNLYQNWTHNFQVKLAKDLTYKFNPALDIKGTPSVRASVQIKAKPKGAINGSFITVHAFNDPNYTTNMESTSVEPDEFYKIAYPAHNYKEFTDGQDPNLFDAYNKAAVELRKDVVNYNTPYLDVNAFYQNVSSFGLKNEYFEFRKSLLDQNDPDYPSLQHKDFWWQPDVWNMPALSEVAYTRPALVDPNQKGLNYDYEIELKLIVDMEFNTLDDDGEYNSVSQILTYKLRPEDITVLNADIFANLENSDLDFMQFEQNLSFKDIVFEGQQVDGCTLNGNGYTCKAWENITLTGTVEAGAGYQVLMVAGNEVSVIPEAEIIGELQVMSEQILDYSHPMPEATTAYLSNFCNGKNPNGSQYQANKPTQKALTYFEQQEQKKEQAANLYKPLDFNLYPNPTRETAFISLNQKTDRAASIEVYDLAGKLQQVAANSGDGINYRLNVSNLANGLYLVKVTAKGETLTKQLFIH